MATIDLSFLNVPAPYIALGSASIDDLSNILEVYDLSTSERRLLTATKDVFLDAEHSYCSVHTVAEELGRSVASVRRVLKGLTEKAIFDTLDCKSNGKLARLSKLYKLNPSSYTQKKRLGQARLPLEPEAKFVSVVEPNNELFGLVDDLMLLLFLCLEFSHKAKTQQKQTRVHIDDEPIKVSATASAGRRIANIRDARYYIALIKLADTIMRQRIESHKRGEIDDQALMSKVFDIYETDLLRSMGMGTGSGERGNAKVALERLDDTRYSIDGAPVAFMDKHNLETMQSRIPHFNLNNYFMSRDKRILYKIEFDERRVKQIFNAAQGEVNALMEIDPRIFKERNPLVIALTLFASSIPTGKIVQHTWQTLKDHVAPAMPMKDFKVSLSKLIDTYAKSSLSAKDYDDALTWDRTSRWLTNGIADINDLSIALTESRGFIIQHNNIKILRSNKKMVYRNIRETRSRLK